MKLAKGKVLPVFLPDTRGVEISQYGSGNLKIGFGIFTYSRLPSAIGGTCPGATDECERICYAKRIGGVVREIYDANSVTSEVPPIPEACQFLRLHVSGDFDTVEYIQNWIARLTERDDVAMWAYTKSWRVPELLPHLERLRALPNVQLFGSMDASSPDAPPVGWRRAWIYRDTPKTLSDGTVLPVEARLTALPVGIHDKQEGLNYTHRTTDGAHSYVCPEETGYRPDCASCGYCFEGQRNDVTFLEH